MDLSPTHHCFDDALEYINQRVLAEPHLAHWSTLWLVHGIATSDAGERYAHAWCEEGGHCWDAAIADGQRIWYAVRRDEFYTARQIQEMTRYTIRSACRHNFTTGHYGPWEAQYRALCGPGHRVFDRIAADASGATIRTWEGGSSNAARRISMKPPRNESHDMTLDLDGNPIAMAPGDVRQMILKLLDEGEILAWVVRRGDEVGVQVCGPPSMELVELLEQAAAGLRKATEGH